MRFFKINTQIKLKNCVANNNLYNYLMNNIRVSINKSNY